MRRLFSRMLLLFSLLIWGDPGVAARPDIVVRTEPVTVTDIVGRQVVIRNEVKRVVLSDFRQVVGLSLVDPDLGQRIVGAGSKAHVGPELRATLEKRFPGITEVPELAPGGATMSAERIIALSPDLVILGAPQGPAVNRLVAQLARADIPAVFIDFRLDLFENTVPSLRIAAQALGGKADAEGFIGFYERHRDRILARAARLEDRPLVLLHLHATRLPPCCMSLGDVSLGRFITAVGGHNIGADVIPVGHFAAIAPEYVLAHQPDVYIATGDSQLERQEGLIVGPGVPEELARQTLHDLITTPVLHELDAVANGRVHGIWHSIYDSPLNILALECLAKWIHPDPFADIDPQATLAEINSRFLPFPFAGTIWTSLGDQP